MSKINKIVRSLTKRTDQLKAVRTEQRNIIVNSQKFVQEVSRNQSAIQDAASAEIDTANQWLARLPSVK